MGRGRGAYAPTPRREARGGSRCESTRRERVSRCTGESPQLHEPTLVSFCQITLCEGHTPVSVVSPMGVNDSETSDPRGERRPRGLGVVDMAVGSVDGIGWHKGGMKVRNLGEL